MNNGFLIGLLILSLLLNLFLGWALISNLPAILGVPEDAIRPQPTETQTPSAPTTPSVPETTVPSVPETTSGPSQPDPTQPPETEPPQTEPPKALYTLQELEALDNTLVTYGPGLAKNGQPAPYAPGAQEKYGKYGASFIRTDKDVIYLTFDCGYEFSVDGVPLTGRILDILKEKNVKAVFFVTMPYVKANPDLVQRMIDEGHTVGNHSVDHKSMPSLTIAEMEEQIMGLHRYMAENFGYSMNLYRPPSGEFSPRSLAVTQNLGYETVHWSFAYADWDTANQPQADAALDKILGCHHDGAIYLLHAVSETNVKVLPQVIDGLRELGYSLELLAKP